MFVSSSLPVFVVIEPIDVSYIAHSPISIDSDDDFETLGFAGSGTEIDPYMIASFAITTTDIWSPCIRISYTTAHFVIRDCDLYTDQVNQTVSLWHVADNTSKIINNTITTAKTGPDTRGLRINFSDGVVVKDNYFVGGEVACRLYRCDNALIQDNNFSTDGTAIESTAAIFSTFVGNNIFEPGLGLHILGSNFNRFFNNTITDSEEHAIYLGRTANCIIAGNHIENTILEDGIQLGYSDDNIICYNWFEGCYQWAIWLGQAACKRNIIHHNIFIDNALGYSTSQAGDSGTDTLWYDSDSSQGNYWNDASGGAYPISGGAFNTDPYPLPGIPVLYWTNLDIPEFPSDDIYEENDYYTEAKPLALNDFYTFVMLDEDYFSLSLERFYTLNVTINYSQFEESIMMGIRNMSDPYFWELQFVNPGDGFSFEYNCTRTDDYYLVVEPVSYFGFDVTTYDLNITTTLNFDIDDIYEENDIFDDAAEYDILDREQELIYTDKDYYKLSLEERNELTVNIAFDSVLVDLDIFLLPHNYDGDLGDVLAQSTTSSQTDEFTLIIATDNDYIICVSSKDTDGMPSIPIDYTLGVYIIVSTGGINSFTIILTIISLFSLAFVMKKFKK